MFIEAATRMTLPKQFTKRNMKMQYAKYILLNISLMVKTLIQTAHFHDLKEDYHIPAEAE